MAKGWALSISNLPRGGLPRNSEDRITDRPDMTSAVDRERKALTQQQHYYYMYKRTTADIEGKVVHIKLV